MKAIPQIQEVQILMRTRGGRFDNLDAQLVLADALEKMGLVGTPRINFVLAHQDGEVSWSVISEATPACAAEPDAEQIERSIQEG
jgi:hypothetical protein